NLDDLFAGRQELPRDADRFVEQAARVSAQVQNQLPHAFLSEFGQRLGQFLIGLAGETAGEGNVAGRAALLVRLVDHERVAHRRQFYFVPLYVNRNRVRRSRALDGYLDWLAFLTAHFVHDLLARPVIDVLLVDCDDGVAVL